jgi:hypothetical protein
LNWIPEFWRRSMLSCAYISSLKPKFVLLGHGLKFRCLS